MNPPPTETQRPNQGTTRGDGAGNEDGGARGLKIIPSIAGSIQTAQFRVWQRFKVKYRHTALKYCARLHKRASARFRYPEVSILDANSTS